MRDYRVVLDASARRDWQHPLFQRCARLASTAQRIISRASQPVHHWYGRANVAFPPTPGGRGRPPLRRIGRVGAQNATSPVDRRREWVGRASRVSHATRHPTQGASRTPPLTVVARRRYQHRNKRMRKCRKPPPTLKGEPRGGRCPRAFARPYAARGLALLRYIASEAAAERSSVIQNECQTPSAPRKRERTKAVGIISAT